MEVGPNENDPELEAAIRRYLSGNKDSEELRRARQRGDQLRREMRAKYGNRNIAVKLVREARGGE